MSEMVIFGAGGRAGRQVVAEAQRRGHQVTAVVRDPARYDLAGVRVVHGDVTDAAQVAEIASSHDATISAAAVYGAETDSAAFFVRSALALRAVHTRLIVVGSSLLPNDSGTLLMDEPGFPAEFRSFCHAHRTGLDVLRASEGLDWLYASPAGDFDHESILTGRDRIRERGDAASRITYADFGIALLDEIDTPKHHREHLAVAADSSVGVP
jgi:putative NADH-flavin reductase